MKKQLQRDRSNKVIGGVCSGMGNYFDADPILFRAIFLVLLFIGGGGVLLYCILWIVLPEKNQPYTTNSSSFYQEEFKPAEEETKKPESENVNITMGLLLLSAGILLLVNNLVPDFDFKKYWPVILIVVGGGLIFGHKKIKESEENINDTTHEESK